MNDKKLLKELGRVGAIMLEGHFVYTSGKHGVAYINKDAIYPHTDLTCRLGKALAKHFKKSGAKVVVAPVVGGVVLSQWVAHHLSKMTGHEVLGVYAEKKKNGLGFEFRRGYDQLVARQPILMVEDILNTGGSARQVLDAAAALKAKVMGVGVICNRGQITPKDLGKVPELYSLMNVQLDAWEAAHCPLCEKHVPINTDVGKGRDYMASYAV